jgi:putative transcriptional regulator
MAIRRMSFDEIAASDPKDVDHAKLDATTDEDIRRYRTEDGEDPDDDPARHAWESAILPQAVRKRVGMTQDQFAAALRIPVATLRNWEQNRVTPDPAVRSLLWIVYKNPEAAFRALAELT